MSEHMSDQMGNDAQEAYERGQQAVNAAKKTADAAKKTANAAKAAKKFVKENGKKAAVKAAGKAVKEALLKKIAAILAPIGVFCVVMLVAIVVVVAIPATIGIVGDEIDQYTENVSNSISQFRSDVGSEIGFETSNFFTSLVDPQKAAEKEDLRNKLETAKNVVASDPDYQAAVDVSNLMTSTISGYFEKKYFDAYIAAEQIADGVAVSGDGTQLLNNGTVAFDSAAYDWNTTLAQAKQIKGDTRTSYNTTGTFNSLQDARITVPAVYKQGTVYIYDPVRNGTALDTISYMDPSFYILSYQAVYSTIQSKNNSAYDPENDQSTLTMQQVIDKTKELTSDSATTNTSGGSSAGGITAETKSYLSNAYYTIEYSVKYSENTQPSVVTCKTRGKDGKVRTTHCTVDVYVDTTVDVYVTTTVTYSATLNPSVIQSISDVYGIDPSYADTVTENVEYLRALYKQALANAGLGTATGDKYVGIDMSFPLADAYTLNDGFYVLRGDKLHGGVDIDAATGTPIYASAAGTVIIAADHEKSDGSGVGGYGYVVVIDCGVGTDGNRYWMLYGHMTAGSICVTPGQTVRAGDKIGAIGSTGDSSGPHLHLEMRADPDGSCTFRTAQKVDPAEYIVFGT